MHYVKRSHVGSELLGKWLFGGERENREFDGLYLGCLLLIF